jgi:RNA polymerase sigma-70 factor (sigma-E family)
MDMSMWELDTETGGRLMRSSAGSPAGMSAGSFDDFVHATGRRTYYAALMLCGDHHLAEDLAQQTYVKVYARWSQVAEMESPQAYAHRVLVWTFLSHRRLRRSSERPVDELPEHVADGPDQSVRMDLVAALRRLPPKDRAVLVLRYWEDLSVARTAELLGIREEACRQRAARALDKLRTLLPHLNESDLDFPTRAGS